ncbi:MAG: hypothetical protein D6734_12105 [Candidatus Schekmanbacteria bacterium]|nr:MAG: hypothetical protein D6734_12105 [Candidatus Schekmanbacteria bacterium]
MNIDCTALIEEKLKERNITTEEITGIDADLLEKTVPNPDGGEDYTSYTWLRRSEKFRKICLGKGGNDSIGYGYAGTIFSDEKYDLPIFAYDIREIKGKILIVLDIKPVLRTDEYLAKYVEPLKKLHSEFSDLESKHLKATWTAEFRSGYGIHCMAEKEKEERVKEAFLSYLDLYLDFAEKAEPVPEETRKKIKEFMDYYTAVYKEKDPGAIHTIKLFGKDWAERHLEILF